MNHKSDEHFLIEDPRLKALSEAKYNQFKTWFDQRLDDAIAAAEQPNNQLISSANGKYAQCASLGTFCLNLQIDFFSLGVFSGLSEFIERLYSGTMHPAMWEFFYVLHQNYTLTFVI